MPANYWLGAVLMDAAWFFGIAFYGTGATGLETLGAVLGWLVFMPVNITAANVWEGLTGEWQGASRRT